MDKVFDFKIQYKIGDDGQQLMVLRFPKELQLQEGKNPDLKILSTGDLVELKTDTYSFSPIFSVSKKLTPNLFMEKYSDKDRQMIGGPWRAKSEGCKYFAYFFLNNDLLYLFETDTLVQLLDVIVLNMPLKNIPNKGWITQGYPIHHKLLDPIGYSSVLSNGESFSFWCNGLETKLNRMENE